MALVIRPIIKEDLKYINTINQNAYACPNKNNLMSARLECSEALLKNLTPNDHVFVAELQEGDTAIVIGYGSLTIEAGSRVRHVAHLNILFHEQHQNQKFEELLIKKLIDLADNWLMLVRIETQIFVENGSQVAFYKTLGFVEEGVRKYAMIRGGKYCDLILMARYRL